MINKKILAVAVATAFTSNVFAADGAFDADYPELEVASQSLTVTDGEYTLTAQTVTNDLGFSIANTTIKYVRYDVVNGTFNTITGLTGNNVTPTLSAGGDGESFVIYEVLASADLDQEHDVVLTATYDVSSTAKSSIDYTLYETAQDAVNAGTGLATDSGDLAEAEDGMTGTYGTSVELTALVVDDFKRFTGNVLTGVLGLTDTDDLLTAGLVNSAGAAWTVANIDATSATVTFTGDFSFGTWDYDGVQWTTDSDGDLAIVTGAPVFNDDGSVTVAYDQGEGLEVVTGASLAAADVALKGSYTSMLDDVTYSIGNADDFSASEDVGSIVYDTTSIEIPYLSTFSGLNQKIFLVNKGTQPAAYTTTFRTEDDVTAADGDSASDTIPAGEMVTIKAIDLVTFTGGTRGMATIEIEAEAGSILATSQTVNIETGNTDTVVLFNDLNTKN